MLTPKEFEQIIAACNNLRIYVDGSQMSWIVREDVLFMLGGYVEPDEREAPPADDTETE